MQTLRLMACLTSLPFFMAWLAVFYCTLCYIHLHIRISSELGFRLW